MQKRSAKKLAYKIQIKHWGGNRQLSIEGIAVRYIPTSIDPRRNEKNLNFIHI